MICGARGPTSSCSNGSTRCSSAAVSSASPGGIHIAAAAPQVVSEEEVPDEVKQAEQRIFEEQAQDKPEQARPKIVEGRWRKWLEENVLLNQEHVNKDKYNGQTIEDLRAATASKTGENVVIRRFARFQVGEEA